MGHYKADLRDIEFNMFEVFGATDAFGKGPYEHWDADAARDVLREVKRLSEEDLAASYVSSDRNPPTFDPETGTVTLPEDFKTSLSAVFDNDWHLLDLPEHLGGSTATPMLRWATAEMFLGSNPAVFMYMAGPAFASIVDRLGTPEQKVFAKTMVDRKWGATMVLTEPEAGSDVGAGRSVAREQADGTWHIEGTKRFITSG